MMNRRFYILFLYFLLGTMKAIGIGHWRCGSTHYGVLEIALWPHSLVGFFGLAFAAAFGALSALVIDSHR